MNREQNRNILLDKSDKLAFEIYRVSKNFPDAELFGLTSQLRRAGMSVPLNIIEGFARQSSKEYIRFLKIAYGSLKETKYLLFFACREKIILESDYNKIIELAEEIGKIIWSKIRSLNNNTEQ